ncbi:hypothetical protein BGW42_002941 [Actinomortierella wolfii]|nr:hypothetical protein BGW42_002941 [Actinomortierella wolfii]
MAMALAEDTVLHLQQQLPAQPLPRQNQPHSHHHHHHQQQQQQQQEQTYPSPLHPQDHSGTSAASPSLSSSSSATAAVPEGGASTSSTIAADRSSQNGHSADAADSNHVDSGSHDSSKPESHPRQQQEESDQDTLPSSTPPPLPAAEQQSQSASQPSPPPPPAPPAPPVPSIPFAVTTPGDPILVKRPNLAPLSISPNQQHGHTNGNNNRSPTTSPRVSSFVAKGLELSPTSRIPFLGGGSDKNSSHKDGSGKCHDIDDMISRLLDAGYSGKISKSICLRNSEMLWICQQAREVFLSQPTLLELNAPVKIVGDIHGQYTDLLRLFEMCGFPPSANFLFLGDYVDRGRMSLETILLLFCYKIKYPENFFLLRGNHECANVTRVYGFYDECKRRSSIKMWKAFVDVFNCLPLAAIVANKIFCVHGGLSPSLGSMDDIRVLRRPTDVPDYGLLNDLLWSDPSDTAVDWEDNERGVSYCFGKSIIQRFLTKHDFDLVCRAHMVVEDGYEFFNERTLVTVFSAPNYCGEFDNYGAVMSVSEELLCSFELLKPIDQATAKAQMQSLAASSGGWRVNKQRLSMIDGFYDSTFSGGSNG